MSYSLFRAEDLSIEFCELEGVHDQIWANYYGYVHDDWFWEENS